MKKISAYAFLLALCGCETPIWTQDFTGPNGHKAYQLECIAYDRSIDHCYKTANKLCPNGYNIIRNESALFSEPYLYIECSDNPNDDTQP